jgi:hypothetical protein
MPNTTPGTAVDIARGVRKIVRVGSALRIPRIRAVTAGPFPGVRRISMTVGAAGAM